MMPLFKSGAAQHRVPSSQLSWYIGGRRVLHMGCVVYGTFTLQVCWLWGKAGENPVFFSSFPRRYRFKRTFLGWGGRCNYAIKIKRLSLLLSSLDFM